LIARSVRRLWACGLEWGAAVWWWGLTGFSAAIFLQSSASVPERLTVDVPGLDKVVHFGAYAVWASLCFAGLRRSAPRQSLFWCGLVAASSAVAFGVSDELHQAFVPGRTADAYDALADLLGAVVAVLFWSFVLRSECCRNGMNVEG